MLKRVFCPECSIDSGFYSVDAEIHCRTFLLVLITYSLLPLGGTNEPVCPADWLIRFSSLRLCHNKQTKVYLPEPPFPHAEVRKWSAGIRARKNFR